MQKPGSKEHCIKHGLNHGQKYKSCIPAYRGFTIDDPLADLKDSVKALADKVNEIIGLINEERK